MARAKFNRDDRVRIKVGLWEGHLATVTGYDSSGDFYNVRLDTREHSAEIAFEEWELELA